MQGHVEEARRKLMDLQARYLALYDEVSMLKRQVQEFEDILFLSQNLISEGEQCWLRAGSAQHGPFCKPCYEYTGKLMRFERHKTVWRCSYCGLMLSREPADQASLAANNPRVRPGRIIPFRFPIAQC